jgi:hypothetical protein
MRGRNAVAVILVCLVAGGAWIIPGAAPYVEERIFYGRGKAKQIKDTGAKLLIAPAITAAIRS